MQYREKILSLAVTLSILALASAVLVPAQVTSVVAMAVLDPVALGIHPGGSRPILLPPPGGVPALVGRVKGGCGANPMALSAQMHRAVTIGG